MFGEPAPLVVAGVVDEHVDRAEVGLGGRRPPRGSTRRSARRARRRRRRSRPPPRCAPVEVHVGHRHARALGRQPPAGGGTDAGRAARDERCAIRESQTGRQPTRTMLGHAPTHRLQGLGRAVRPRHPARLRRGGRARAASSSSGVSDHFQPWRHNGGHSPAALPWLAAAGQRTGGQVLGTSVLTPTLRYHPSVIAQAFATLGCLTPGRVFLGVGHRRGDERDARHGRRVPGPQGAPAAPGGGDRADPPALDRGARGLRGRLLPHPKATIYDRPDEPVPIYVAASGPLAAKLAGRVGDGFICTSGKDPALYDELLGKVAEGAARRGPRPGADPAHDRDQGLL